MSIAALNWAFRLPVTGTRKAVIVALANVANDHGVCWLSVATLGLHAGAGERAIRNALRDLERAGIIVTDQSRGRTSSRYRLALNPASGAGNETREGDRDQPQPGTSCPVTRHLTTANPASDDTQPGTICPLALSEPIKNHKGTERDARAETAIVVSLFPDLPDEGPEPMAQAVPEPAKRKMLGKGSGRRKPETPVDPNFWPDGQGQAYAAGKRITDLEAEVNKFINLHAADDLRYRDWAWRWRGWCDRFPALIRNRVNGRGAPMAGGNGGGLFGVIQRMAAGGRFDG